MFKSTKLNRVWEKKT